MKDTTPSSRITPAFNVVLFLFAAATGILQFMLSENAQAVPIEGLVMTTALDMVRFLIVMFITAYFVREVWNRLVSNIFTVRTINTQEAIAIILVLSVMAS